MIQRALGNSSLRTSAVAFGCMSIGDSRWRPWVLNEPEARGLLEHACQAGVNFFDTANVYSAGESERVLGHFISNCGIAREELVVATKAFYPTPYRMEDWGLGRSNVIGSLEASLKRLNLDYVDLYQIHAWDDATPIEDTMAALKEVVDSGKALAVGASNLSAWQLATAQLVAKDEGWSGFDSVQLQYNLLYREEERDLLPFCETQGIGKLAWSPLARGRLARIGVQRSSQRAKLDDVADRFYGDTKPDQLRVVQTLAGQLGASTAQIATAWIIAKGVVPIVGCSSVEQLTDTVAATSIDLTDDQLSGLEAAYVNQPLKSLPRTSASQATPEEMKQWARP